jgi:tRNA(Ile)-lysidine synthase
MICDMYLAIMKLIELVAKTITEQKLLNDGDHVLVALSGGPDSVALLHMLTQFRSGRKLQIGAVYINHQIRKQAALKEERFCKLLCEQLDVPLTVVRQDIPALARQEKIGLEEAGRAFRYELFDQLAAQQKYTKIALGHHLDDRVETILFRIVRGTGRSGLSGIPVKRGKIIRPLFDISKAQILEYLQTNRLSYCTDQSNLRSEFSRNYIRNKLLPELRRRLNPQVDRALLNLSETVAAEEAVLERQMERAIRQSVSISPGGKIELDRNKICGYTDWVRRRLLKRCLESISDGRSVDRETVERLDRQIRESAGDLSLPGRIQVRFVGPKVVFVLDGPIQLQSELILGQSVWLDCLQMRIISRVRKRPPNSPKSVRRAKRVAVDADKLLLPLTVRTIQPGDRFQPLGMSGRKKVGDYLTDRKVPKVYRDEIVVVADSRGIIWVVGYEIADRVKVDRTTRKVVTIEVNIPKRALTPAV